MNTGRINNDESELSEQLQSINYDMFRNSSFIRRFGMFRGVAGRIDGVPIVVGTTRNDSIVTDLKIYPLPDSLKNKDDISEELARQRLPLSPRELRMVKEFMKTGLFELKVDESGNICGKISSKVRFERTDSQERMHELLNRGYKEIGGGFYIDENT